MQLFRERVGEGKSRMPLYQTRTIAGILEPVAQQVFVYVIVFIFVFVYVFVCVFVFFCICFCICLWTIAGILEPVAQQVSIFVFVFFCICISNCSYTKPSLCSGEQVDHPARGGGGWQLYAGPSNPSPGRQQGCGKPRQVKFSRFPCCIFSHL